ncbi:MAG TPA: hypothetical protein VGS08_01095 [Candidatus Saccharimonadales bacterium]|nr:hypothetical protein [Candidatus Saccharimonadales bacterium]
MNEDVVQDLKQFISTTVSQQTASLQDSIHLDLQRLDQKLTSQIGDLSHSVADAIETSNEVNDRTKTLDDHERRIARLEQRLA